MTILEAAQRLRRREVSSVELTKACLERIERDGGKLNAFITVTAEAALEEARRRDEEIERGNLLGPLHGIPVAVKDVFCTAGVRTTCGSALFADYAPGYDAAVVEKLREAGAVLVGKTNMHELAYGITSNNPHFGPVRNPWAPERIPGGSSGGSAAAAAKGMAFMAMGSDTGGSIRIPASYCGVVGLKPTTGRVSRYGVLPLDFTLDHMGPLARTVRDAAATLNAIAGHDPRDPSSSRRPVEDYAPPPEISLKGVRVGVAENFFFENVEDDVEAAVKRAVKAAQEAGAEVVAVRVPDIEAINVVGRVILFVEASAVMERYLKDRSKIGADVLSLLDQGRLIPATDYVQAQRLRRLMMEEFARVWEQADCLLTPTTPLTAPRIGEATVTVGGVEEDVRLATTRFVRSFNVLGLPALSLPCGRDERGMPVGLQVIGPPFRERRVLEVGAAIEDAIGTLAPPED